MAEKYSKAAETDPSQQLARAITDYVAAVRAATAQDEAVPPIVTADSGVTETDVMIVIDALLSEAHLDLFEVQMWRSLGSSF